MVCKIGKGITPKPTTLGLITSSISYQSIPEKDISIAADRNMGYRYGYTSTTKSSRTSS